MLTRAVRSSLALRDNAFVYGSDEECVDRSAAFLREGLAAGEGGLVANTRHGLAMMRDALGPDAERVAFIDAGSTYTRPGAHHRGLLRRLPRAASTRALGTPVVDVQLGPTPAEWDEWTGYEAMTNLAYGHLPVWVWCTHGANGVPDRTGKVCGGPTPRCSPATGRTATASKIPERWCAT